MKKLIQKERTHLFAPSINIVLLATIGGGATKEQLTTSISEAVAKNEILTCKIQLDDNGEAYYVKTDTPLVSIHVTNDNWQHVVKEQEHIPFDLENGELIRFFIKEEKDDIQLLIIAHHLAGDGLSITYLLEDIMNVLDGNTPAYKPLQLYSLNEIPADGKLNLLTRFLSNRLNKKWNKAEKIFSFAEFRNMFSDYWANRETAILYDELPETDFLALKKIAKENDITFNSVITTALSKAAVGKSDIGIAVSIRPKAYHGMGNYATGVSIQYSYNTSKNFWANAKIIHGLIDNKLTDNRKKFFLLQFMGGLSPTLIDSAYFSAFGKYESKIAATVRNMFGYNSNPESISLTNLTKLDIKKQYGKYSINNLIFVPPLVPNARRIVGISTLENRVVISLHIENNELLSAEKIFFENAMNILKQLSRE